MIEGGWRPLMAWEGKVKQSLKRCDRSGGATRLSSAPERGPGAVGRGAAGRDRGLAAREQGEHGKGGAQGGAGRDEEAEGKVRLAVFGALQLCNIVLCAVLRPQRRCFAV